MPRRRVERCYTAEAVEQDAISRKKTAPGQRRRSLTPPYLSIVAVILSHERSEESKDLYFATGRAPHSSPLLE